MDEKANVKLTIDGKEVVVPEGMTILDAAKANGIPIPTLCHHPALSGWGGCRICVVEVDGAPRLVASCVMPVREGMQVVTSNPRIIEARRTILEFLFAERNHYCMFCAQSGDCELQNLAYELQMDHLTVTSSFRPFPVDATDEYMALDHNRCILCGRCVRACRELAGNFVLNFQNRGAKTLICKDLNEWTEDSTCDGSGVCMQVCPTGAIFNRYRTHYAVKGKEKDLETVDSHCPRCGFLCPTRIVVRDNHLIKIDGVLETDRPDRGQLCRKGRFEPMKDAGERLLSPMIRGWDGSWIRVTWETALDLVAERLSPVRTGKAEDGVFGLVSDGCSNEELLFFRDLMKEGFGATDLDTLEGSHLRTIQKAWDSLRGTFLALREAPWRRIAEADLILLAGMNSFDRQPILSSLVRRGSIERGAKVVVIGPTDILSPWPALHIPTEKGGEVSLLKAILAEVITSIQRPAQLPQWKKIVRDLGDVRVSDLLSGLGLHGEALEDFHAVVRSWVASKAPVVVAGEGLTGLGDPAGLVFLAYLAVLKGMLPQNTMRYMILKPGGNSAAALRLGIPAIGRGDEDAPRKKGLFLLAGNDRTDDGLLDRLDRAEFLTVIGPHVPASLKGKAHVLIPRPSWLEEEGTYTSLDGIEAALCQGVLTPATGIRKTWETLMGLAQRTGYRPDFSDWEGLKGKALREMNLSVG